MKSKSVQLPGTLFARGTSKWWMLWVLAVIIFAVFEYAGLLQWLRNSGEIVTHPVRQVTAQVGQIFLWPVNLIRISVRKYSYVLDLELRYAEVTAQLGEIQQLRSENQQLRGQLAEQATQSSSARSRVFAPIISYTQPTIGSGSQTGVETGDVVFISGVAVGRVVNIEMQEASVRLFSDRSVNEVLIAQTESGVSGIIRGNGSDIFLEEIPIESSLHIGERTVTIGQVGVRPGIYLGKIKEIIRQEGSPTQTAVIDQGVSFYRASAVEVGK